MCIPCFVQKVNFSCLYLPFQQYEKWSDEQRKRIIEDLVHGSKLKQLQFAQILVNEKVPMKQEDFTRVLPKVLCVYLFSFLDPRSLCRCSRVRILSFVNRYKMYDFFCFLAVFPYFKSGYFTVTFSFTVKSSLY